MVLYMSPHKHNVHENTNSLFLCAFSNSIRMQTSMSLHLLSGE